MRTLRILLTSRNSLKLVALLTLVVMLMTLPVDVTYASSNGVVISEFAVRGPNGSDDEFVELYNMSDVPVIIGGMVLRGSTSTGQVANRATIFPGTVLNPGCHYLLTTTSPSPYSGSVDGDQFYFSEFTDDGGIALVKGSAVIDAVGMSTGSAFLEGTPLASLGSTNTSRSYQRIAGAAPGTLADSDNNASDFVVRANRDPQNSFSPCFGAQVDLSVTAQATPGSINVGDTTLLTATVTPATSPDSTGITVVADLSSVGGLPNAALLDDGSNGDNVAGDNTFSLLIQVPQSLTGSKFIPVTVMDQQGRSITTDITLAIHATPLTIPQIQGAGQRSTHEGQLVETSGIVTALKPNGFFMQDPAGDGDPATSDGIFVLTSGPPTVLVGNDATVTGTVVEFAPTGDPAASPLTEIAGNPSVVVNSIGNVLPDPVILTAADVDLTGSVAQLEKYEGMRVHVDALDVVAPTEGTVNEPNATAATNGVFFGVISGLPRPFRQAGIEQPAPAPSGPCCVPFWNGAPQKLRVDTKSQTTSSPLDLTTGAVVANVTGPLDFDQHSYTIVTDSAPAIVQGNVAATPAPAANANEFTVASLNLQRFYDNAVLTTTAFNNRLNKTSLAVRHVMNSPDVIGVQEVENLATLQALADKVNADALAETGVNPQYTPYLAPGNDPDGLNVGLLVRARVTVNSVTQSGKDATFVDPSTLQSATLYEHPPLLMQASVTNEHETTSFTVVVSQLQSLGPVDSPVDGARVREQRRKQAEFLAGLLQSLQAAAPDTKVVSVGDYNASEFNDGYVDVMGTLMGQPTAGDNVLLSSSDLVDPNLVDLQSSLPAVQRYSFIDKGVAVALDHVLVNQPMNGIFSRFAFGRSNADFPESYRNDSSRPERLSDHDMPVAYFLMPVDHTPPVLTLPADFTVQASSQNGVLVNYTASAMDSNDGPVAAICNLPSGATFPIGVNTVSCTAKDKRQNSASGFFKVTVQPPVSNGDKTPPVVKVTGVTDGAVYVLGAVPDAGCKTTDTGSGVAVFATLSVTGGNANHVGKFTATCSGARDKVGNVAPPVSASYKVRYHFNGIFPWFSFYQFEVGDTVPLLWRLTNAHGRTAGSLSSMTSLMVAANTNCSGNPEGKPFVPPSANRKGLTFERFYGLFGFEWNTKGLSAGCYSVQLSLDDGSMHSETIKLRPDHKRRW